MRKVHFLATIEKHTIDTIEQGTDEEIVKGVRRAVGKKLTWLERMVFNGMSNDQLFDLMTDHWNDEHQDAPVACPKNCTEFIDLTVSLGMARVLEG